MVAPIVFTMMLQNPEWIEGGITYYYHDGFEGNNLKCPGYRYEPETGPWLALDISMYEEGLASCGDLFLVEFSDGSREVARALDSGRLAEYRCHDSGLPFVADLPSYWRNGRKTATGRILNLSALERELPWRIN